MSLIDKKLLKKWEALIKSSEASKAEDLYNKNIFPQILNRIADRHKSERDKYYGIILIVGTSPEPLIMTLHAFRPQKVYFLYTKESEPFLRKVISGVSYLKSNEILYSCDLIEPTNTAEIYQKIKQRRQLWGEDKQIAVDNTGGKKSMVSAAASAAHFLGIDLLYVDTGKYMPEIRKPEPGTEEVKLLANPVTVLGELKLSKAIELFNDNSYETSYSLARTILSELGGEQAIPVKERVQLFLRFAKAYLNWDNFNYSSAFKNLESASAHQNQWHLKLIDHKTVEEQLKILNELQSNQSSNFFKLLGKSSFSKNQVLELLLNAKRRVSQHHYDDAVIRVYRSIELISQHRLALHGLETRNFPWEDEKLKEVIQRYDKIAMSIYRVSSKEKIRHSSNLGLMDGHIFLKALGDELWSGSGLTLEELKDIVDLRNELFLIHGLENGNETKYRKLASFAENLFLKAFDVSREEYMEIRKKHQFPEIESEI
jgi:CRISPR-associated protein (TIGR02710 family)